MREKECGPRQGQGVPGRRAVWDKPGEGQRTTQNTCHRWKTPALSPRPSLSCVLAADGMGPASRGSWKELLWGQPGPLQPRKGVEATLSLLGPAVIVTTEGHWPPALSSLEWDPDSVFLVFNPPQWHFNRAAAQNDDLPAFLSSVFPEVYSPLLKPVAADGASPCSARRALPGQSGGRPLPLSFWPGLGTEGGPLT